MKDSTSESATEIRDARCRYTSSLFGESKEEPGDSTRLNRANLGTFQDSLRAPVHRWFTYPAGFSYKAVEEAFRLYHLAPGQTVYDPFAGTGTTNIVAKQHGISSFGAEAHPFVHFVATTKLHWEFDYPDLLRRVNHLIGDIRSAIAAHDLNAIPIHALFPELVCKCYHPLKLAQLYLCRESIHQIPESAFRNFAKLGLTGLLRSAADVATGWPYIAPQKAKGSPESSARADIPGLLQSQLYQMAGDLQEVSCRSISGGQSVVLFGDSRERQESIRETSVDLAFTSPPYLNNYDYADRTRLETYFWGEAKTWGDITHSVRTRLIMSATTQINRSEFDAACLLSADFTRTVPALATELTPKIAALSALRLTKGGKKNYDILVAGYFNDMLRVLRETYRVLKPGSPFVLLLGDSAPYGVYIPTDRYLGEIGKAVGFAGYEVEELRTRGGKWKDNPQRHHVALKECVLTLVKG